MSKTGIFLEEENNKPTVRWTGIMLTKPAEAFHVKPIVPDRLRPVTIEPKVVQKRSVVTAEARKASYEACVAWLAAIMTASPTERTESKASLWGPAQEKWPATVSSRRYQMAWIEAVNKSGAIAWGAPGARKKKYRSKSAHR